MTTRDVTGPRAILAALLLAALTACSSGAVPIIDATSAATTPNVTPSPTTAPFPIKIDHVTVHRIANGPRDWFTAEPGDDRGNHIPAGSSVISVQLTVRNVIGSPVGLPTGVPLQVQYGPTAADAEQIAPQASYREPHVVPAGGTAVLESLFLLPSDQIVGAVIYAPLPQHDGTDTSGPRQTIQITKVKR